LEEKCGESKKTNSQPSTEQMRKGVFGASPGTGGSKKSVRNDTCSVVIKKKQCPISRKEKNAKNLAGRGNSSSNARGPRCEPPTRGEKKAETADDEVEQGK